MLYLSLRNIVRRLGSSIATLVIIMLAAAVAMAGIVTYLSLQKGIGQASERLGADIIVLPLEVGVSAQEALFTAEPANIYLPSNSVDIISTVDGVAQASPQFFTQTLNQSCCSVMGVTRVVGIDMATDFVISPWLSSQDVSSLADDEIILGCNAPEVVGDVVSILGNQFKVAGRLDATGSSVDETIFMNLEVARRIAAESPYLEGVWRESDPYSSISCVMVKVQPGADVEGVAEAVAAAYPNASVTAVSGLVKNTSAQLSLLSSVFAVLVASILLMAVLALTGRFSAMVKDRRKEIGFMRAVGFSRSDVVRSLLGESGLVALAGGLLGSSAGVALSFSLSRNIQEVLALPNGGIGPLEGIAFVLAGTVLALALGVGSSLGTALRYSGMDPQVAMQRGDL